MNLGLRCGKTLARSRSLQLLALLCLAPTVAASFSESAQNQKGSCSSVLTCVKQLRHLAAAETKDADSGMGDAEDSVCRGFGSVGSSAISPLLNLLADKDASVRTLAGYCVRGMPGIGPQHLPVLIRAVENGDGWLPYTIGKIGTPEALDFLLRQLRKEPEDDSQVTAGLAAIGARAAPGLGEFFRCGATCDRDLLYATCSVLDEMDEKAAAAVPVLQAVAGDSKSALVARSLAIECLGRLRRVATEAVPTLLTIESSGGPELQEKAREAILQIGGDGTTEVIRRKLAASKEKWFVLLEIAALRERGRDLGPAVKVSLSSKDEAERVAAAYALGRIGYTASWPELVVALKNEDDPLLAGSAAESLGRLKVQGSRPALEEAAASYWYPRVRIASTNALSALAGQHQYQASDLPGSDTEFSTYAGSRDSIEACASADRFPKAPADPDQLDAARAKGLVYDSEVVGYGEKGRVVKPIKVTPEVGIRVSNGWVLGADRGEWGGDLVFRQDALPAVRLLEDNIHGVFRFPNQRIVAVAGLAHLGGNSGRIYEVKCLGAGKCSAEWWKQLPASPREVWMTKSGQLLINTYSGGSVIVDQDGRLSMAPCHAEVVR
jgi:HEAT repeat protein